MIFEQNFTYSFLYLSTEVNNLPINLKTHLCVIIINPLSPKLRQILVGCHPFVIFTVLNFAYSNPSVLLFVISSTHSELRNILFLHTFDKYSNFVFCFNLYTLNSESKVPFKKVRGKWTKKKDVVGKIENSFSQTTVSKYGPPRVAASKILKGTSY